MTLRNVTASLDGRATLRKRFTTPSKSSTKTRRAPFAIWQPTAAIARRSCSYSTTLRITCS